MSMYQFYTALSMRASSSRHTITSSLKRLPNPDDSDQHPDAIPLRLSRLALLRFSWLDSSHHFFLSNEVVNPFKEPKQTLHVRAPLVQDVIRISRPGKADNACWSVDLCVDRLRGHQLADVLLSLILGQVEELGQATHLDPSVVLGYNAHVMFDNPLAQIFPAL